MDYRQYDNAIGRFLSIDRLSELAYSNTPYKFSFNNPLYFRDPTGLLEQNSESLEHCPTCPNTPEFKPLIDDPNNTYYYDPETNQASLILDEVVVTKNSSSSSSSDIIFWSNIGLGAGGTAFGYLGETHLKNELWHSTKTRGVSNVLQNRWYNNGAKYWRNKQLGELKGPRNVGTALSVATIGLTAYSVVENQNIKTSDMINVALSGLAIGVPGIGTTIAGAYFLADLVTMGTTYLMTGKATSIGEYIDNQVEQATGKKDGAIIDWRK
jgi:hypothetical protein